MNHSKKIITVTMIISIFVLTISIISWYVQLQLDAGTFCSCAIPLPILIPVTASIGLLIGTVIYYIFAPNPENKLIDRKMLHMFFSGEEARIIEKILDCNGELSQTKIVNLTGIPKVRVFRTLERLKMKNAIKKEPHGKTNMIKINHELAKLFIR